MGIIKKIMRFSCWFLGIIILLIGTLLLVIQTQSAKDAIARYASQTASSQEQRISIGTITGTIPWNINISHVSLADTEGTWLDIEDIVLKWQPLALALGDVVVDTATIEQVTMHRMAQTTQTNEKEDTPLAQPFRIADLPDIMLGHVAITEINLPAEITSAKATRWQLMLKGSRRIRNGFSGIIHTTQGPSTLLSFEGSADESLKIEALFKEERAGLVGSLSGLKEKPLSAKLALSYDNTHIDAALQADYGNVTLADIIIEKADTLRLSGNGTIPDQINRSLNLPDQQWAFSGTVSQDNEWLKLSQSTFQLSNLKMKLHGGWQQETHAFEDIAIDTSIPDLRVWSDVIQQPLSGDLAIRNTLEGSTEEATFNTEITSNALTIEALNISDLSLQHRLGTNINGWIEDGWNKSTSSLNTKMRIHEDTASLNANIDTDANQGITISNIILASPYGQLSGKAGYNLKSTKLSADIKADAISLMQATKQMQGNLALNIKADGTLTSLPVLVNIDAKDLAQLPSPLNEWMGDQAQVSIDAHYKPTLLSLKEANIRSDSLDIAAKGSIPLTAQQQMSTVALSLKHNQFSPITADASILYGKDTIEVSEATIETEGARIDGNVVYYSKKQTADGTLALDAQNIAPLGMWLGLPQSTGTLRANIDLNAQDKAQKVAAQATINDLKLPDARIATEKLSFSLTASDLKQMQNIEASLLAENMVAQTLRLNTLNADINSPDGTRADTLFSAKLSGTQDGRTLMLDTSGLANIGASIDAPNQSLKLNTLKATYDTLDIALKEPATLARSASQMSLSNTVLNVEGGTITAQGNKDSSTVDASIIFNAIPLKPFIASAAPSAPDSVMNATMLLSGKSAAPVMKLDAFVDVSAANGKTEGLHIELASLWDNGLNAPVITNNVTFSAKEPLGKATLSIPATFSLQPAALTLSNARPLLGNADLDIPTAQLNNYIAPLGHKLEGLLQTDVDISGTLAAPKTKGTLTWKKGAYDNLQFGACLKNIDLDASFTDTALDIVRLKATGDRGKGTLEASGHVDLTASTMTSNVAMYKLAMFCQGIAEGEIGGFVGVNGTFDNINAAGDVALGPLSISIPGGGADNIPSIEHVYASQLKEKNGQEGIVNLDIDVSLPQRVFVRGRGLEAEFEGALDINGTALSPLIDGKLQTRRGKLDLLGSQLNIEKGVISFLNRDPSKPYIDMRAQSETSGVTIQVDLKGSVKKPELTFSSTPSRPQDEIFALLLFGRPLQEITPFQALQLAQAAATLAGKGGGSGVLGSARDALGIDTLDVSQDADGGTTLGAGKYITDRVFVGVEQGTTPASRRVKTEIELTPNIKAETSTGVQGGANVGVEWRYDY